MASHSNQLEIDRAHDGIDKLNQCIKDLDSLNAQLGLWAYTGRDVPLKEVWSTISETIGLYFPSEEAAKLRAEADITRGIRFDDRDRRDVKRDFESNIAQAKDALQRGIDLLNARIATLKGTPLKPPPLSLQAEEPAARKREDLVKVEPTIPFTGIKFNVNEMWRRWRERRG